MTRLLRKLIWSLRRWIGLHVGIEARGRCFHCEALVPQHGTTPYCPRPVCECYEP